MDIPADIEAKADEIITHYPVSKRSAALPLLHLLQEHFGYISGDTANWIAAKLDLKKIHILELLTFYPMFRQEPAGKHHIRVCRTLSCALAGSYDLLQKFCDKAGIENHPHGEEFGNHTLKSKNGKYSIEFVECLASCGTGPVCMINDDFHEAIKEEDVDTLLKKYN